MFQQPPTKKEKLLIKGEEHLLFLFFFHSVPFLFGFDKNVVMTVSVGI